MDENYMDAVVRINDVAMIADAFFDDARCDFGGWHEKASNA